MAKNKSHWLKVQSNWFKNKVYFDQLLDFPIFLHTLNIIVPYFTLWMLDFFNITGCQLVLIQIRPNKMLGLVWIQTVCKGYQHSADKKVMSYM